MKKLIIICAALVLFSQTVSATEYSHATMASQPVHQIYVSMLSDSIKISTKVGKLNGAVCVFEKETQVTDYPHNDPYTPYSLSSNKLAELVGTGFNCASSHLVSGWGKEYTDEFELILDAQGNYIDSKPHEVKIKL